MGSKLESGRLLSLDVFRGLTIACMIFVNTPGSWSYVYPPFRHADWNGCTPTDLVFPFFLFIVGVSLWFSFKKFDHRLSAEATSKIIKRGATIFLIGLLLNYFPFIGKSIAELRILGVLQRIGLAFTFGGLICLGITKRNLLIISGMAILLLYWALMLIGSDMPYGLETNLVRKIDIALLGEAHLWRGKGLAFDPEGLLSTLPSVGTVIFGYLIGQLISTAKNITTVYKMICVGVVAIILALVWSIGFPINKSLWTSSFVLYTGGIATIVLALFYWLIDINQLKSWTMPFVVFGKNPLFAYIISIIWVKLLFVIKVSNSAGEQVNLYNWIYQDCFVPMFGNMNGSAFFALAHVILFWLVCLYLYRRQIFIKV